MRHIKILLVALVAFATTSKAQDFSIKFAELSENGVVVYYDLIDTVKERTYSIYVYSSRDNFLAPLKELSGDQGLEVKPGKNKKIAWNAKQELGATFNGAVELEIRGRVYVPFLRFQGFEHVPVYKRKTPFIVKWAGGTRQNILNFQLYKGEKLVHTFPNAPNESQYTIEIPNTVKPGTGYFFRISDTKNKEQVVVTPQFTVKRKIPLIVKAIPLAIIGFVAYKLFSGSKGNDELDLPPGAPEE